MSQKNPTNDDWGIVRDHQILLRLYKLKEAGVSLPVSAQKTYDRIQGNLAWQPRGDRSEEFSFFTSSGTTATGLAHESEFENFGEMSTDQFIQWSKKQEGEDIRPWECGSGWSEFAKGDFQAAMNLLKGASAKGVWPISPWYYALGVSEQKETGVVTDALKQEVARLLINMPVQVLGELALQASRWFETVWRQLNKTLRRKLWRKIRDASVAKDEPQQDLDFSMTLNHAGGILGNILYDELSEYIPLVEVGKNCGFPRLLKQDFLYIAENDNPSAKLARVRLASMLFVLYRIDPAWVEHTFFLRMDPEDEETFDPYLWEGYLWYSRCSADLLEAFKPLLFKILQHLDNIPEHSRDRAVSLFTYLAVPPDRGISTEEAKSVLWELGPDKLTSVAETLRDTLQGADEKSLALWRDSIEPWFDKAWPKRPDDRSLALSESLARMAIDAGEAFPAIVDTIKDILTPESYGASLHFLDQEEQSTRLVSKYPQASLSLIDKLVHNDSNRKILDRLLKAISKEYPALKETGPFKRLSEML